MEGENKTTLSTELAEDGLPEGTFLFVPQKTGLYEIYSAQYRTDAMFDYHLNAYLFDEKGNCLTNEGQRRYGSDFHLCYPLKKEKEYYLRIGIDPESEESSVSDIHVPVIVQTPAELWEGFQTVPVSKKKQTLSFTAEETGEYLITSQDGWLDTQAVLKNQKGKVVASDDNSGNGSNFLLQAKLEGGKKYSLTYWADTDQTVNIRIIRTRYISVGESSMDLVPFSDHFLAFIPDRTGRYTFCVKNERILYARIEDANENYMGAESYKHTEDGLFLTTEKELVEGKLYYDHMFLLETESPVIVKVYPVVRPIQETDVSLKKTRYNYDGKAHEPKVTIRDGSYTLQEDLDYTVSYKDNTKPGTARAIIKGIGSYSGKTTAKFTIVDESRVSLKKADISLQKKSFKYTGKKIQPSVTVKLDGKQLVRGADYTVTYKNNKNAGTAKAIITGTGRYTGKATRKFTIQKASIKQAEVLLDHDTYVYDGKAQKPTVTVDLGGVILKKGRDYTLAYKNNKEAGRAKVIIQGKGNLQGKAEKTFTIIQKSEFLRGEDDWQFYAGSISIKKTVRETLGEEYLKKLKKNMTADEWEFIDTKILDKKVRDILPDYGMAVSSLLFKFGILKPEDYQAGAKTIYDLKSPKKNEAVAALILYYEMLVYKETLQEQLWTMQVRGRRYAFDQLFSTLDEYGIALIDLRGSECWDGMWFHTDRFALAIGYETENQQLDGKTYDRQIHIYDPRLGGVDILYNTKTYEWTSDNPFLSRRVDKLSLAFASAEVGMLLGE